MLYFHFYSVQKFSLSLFFFGCASWRTLVPQPGIEPEPLAVKVQSLNHWTPREVPQIGV